MRLLQRTLVSLLLFCASVWAQNSMLVYPGSSGSTNTFTAVHAPSAISNSCLGTASCAITITSTGSGNLLTFMFTNTSGAADYATACTGAGTCVCPASAQKNNATIGAVSFCYVLSSTSGQTSVTVTFGVSSNYIWSYSETSYSPGPIALDTCNTNQNTSASTSNPGVTGTITGSSDYAVQWIVVSTGDPSAITTYTNPVFSSGLHTGAANLLNTASGTAPTWTTASAQSVTGGCWFK